MKARKKNGAREMELRAAQEDFFTVAIGSEERHLRQLMIHPGVMGDSKRTQTQRRGYLPAAVPSGRAFLKSPVKVSRFLPGRVEYDSFVEAKLAKRSQRQSVSRSQTIVSPGAGAGTGGPASRRSPQTTPCFPLGSLCMPQKL
jgi:hypothetical protein